MTYGDMIRNQMRSDEGLAKVLAEFSIGCLAKLVTKGEISQPKSGWAEIKEEIRGMQLKVIRTECK